MSSTSSSLTITSKSTVYPSTPTPTPTTASTAAAAAAAASLKLSVSDLPMLSRHYIQKGVLLPEPPYLDSLGLAHHLKQALSLALSHFPALAGRLSTDPLGHVHILCNDAGVDFIEARAKNLTVRGVLSPHRDVPDCVKQFFAFDRTVSYKGHSLPLLAVQVTELADGAFVGCTVNHAVTDGTSFWHFFNSFAEAARGLKRPLNAPDFCRDNAFVSPLAILPLPAGGPAVTCSQDEPLRKRIFHFSPAAIQEMKSVANGGCVYLVKITSFQSLCGQLWRSVTRARKLTPSKTSTFWIKANCRRRIKPRLKPYYFGNATQSIPTAAPSGELLSHDLGWCARRLHRNVVLHRDATVRRGIEAWEREPQLFPPRNFDGASITMGSSPLFPMSANDFGWGWPLAVRSGRANEFDGKISAFPGRKGGGSIDLEVVLAPATMARLENDAEFLQYVSSSVQ